MDLAEPWAYDRPMFQGQPWESGEGLYRWSDGSRVLLDADGAGRAWASRPVRWLTEAGSALGVEVVFAEHCVALTPDDEPVTVWAGNALNLDGRGESGLTFSGPGWIVAADWVCIDGEPRCVWIPGQAPIPVIHRAEGEGLRFLPSGLQSKMLDAFPFTKSELMARGGTVTNLSVPAAFETDSPHAASLLNRAEWPLDLPVGTVALALRKSYDRFHGRQRCRVLVNDEAAAWWHLPRENRAIRPGEAWISVPLLGQTGTIRLALDPPAGVPLWSIGELEVRALIR